MSGLQLPTGWETWPAPRKESLRNTLRMAKFRVTYTDDPEAFLYDCIDWDRANRRGGPSGPTEYQVEALVDLYAHKRLAIRGPHGLGKTGIAAFFLWHFALTRDGVADWKAPTTASVWRQLKEFLWPEIHKWHRYLNWPLIGREPLREGVELQDMAIRLATGSAFAVASDQPAAIEGAHADSIGYVYDEAKTISEDTFDASEGAFSTAGGDTGGEAFALALSTPGDPEGRFYAIHRRDPRFRAWHAKHIKKERAIAAGRISAEWVLEKQQQWGPDSAVYQNRVEGEFAASSEQSVIPLAWVEAAVDRWRSLRVPKIGGGHEFGPLPAFKGVGVDVADQGDDSTVLAICHGQVITELRTFAYSPDPMQTAGHVVAALRGQGLQGFAVVDVIGVGSGVMARMKELRGEEADLKQMRLVAFNASHKSTASDQSGELEFANLRAEAWWAMREALDPTQPGGSDVALPDSDTLLGDLTAPRWKMTSGGKVLIESKDDIRKRLGRSPDEGDAVVMIMHARPPRSRSWSPADARL